MDSDGMKRVLERANEGAKEGSFCVGSDAIVFIHNWTGLNDRSKSTGAG